jgi:hypothetical protein
LRELHYDGRPHGWVNAAAIVLTPGGAVLKGGNPSRQATLGGDIAAFGALFYEMINGRKTGPDVPLPVVLRTVPRTGPDGLKMAANRLASRCLAEDSVNMQKVVTEVRLLKVLSRQLQVREPQAPWQPHTVESPAVEPADEEAPPMDRDYEEERAAGERVTEDADPSGDLCPRCGSANVFTSKARSMFEGLLRAIGSPVCRCHRCYHRYFVFLGMHIAKSHSIDTVRTKG